MKFACRSLCFIKLEFIGGIFVDKLWYKLLSILIKSSSFCEVLLNGIILWYQFLIKRDNRNLVHRNVQIETVFINLYVLIFRHALGGEQRVQRPHKLAPVLTGITGSYFKTKFGGNFVTFSLIQITCELSG